MDDLALRVPPAVADRALDVYPLAGVEVGQTSFCFVPLDVLLYPDFFSFLRTGDHTLDIELRFSRQDWEGSAHSAPEKHFRGGLPGVVGRVLPLQEVVLEHFPLALVFLEEVLDLFDAGFCETVRLRMVGAAGLRNGDFAPPEKGEGFLGRKVRSISQWILPGLPNVLKNFLMAFTMREDDVLVSSVTFGHPLYWSTITR